MVIREHAFAPRDIVGGHVALDLVNTVTARNAAEPVDWLDGYPRVLEWAALTGAFEPADLRALGELYRSGPRRGARALAQLVELREALHDIATALVEERTPPDDALARLEAQWKEAVSHAHIATEAGGLTRRLEVERSGLAFVAHVVAIRALELLEHWPAGRARVCPGDHCGWVFVDHSRGGQRRWCDMATCGNAAKSRRQYLKGRAAER